MKNLTELINANIVSEEVAKEIRTFNAKKDNGSSNKLLIVFGILGAILVGLGVILVLAHNWDELPRGIKVVFAFLPLIIGQLVCAYTLLKKPESTALRESSTAFLILAIGSSISLVSQIYNIPGNVNTFLLSWMLLSLPLVYIMKSSIGSLLYLVGITCYAAATGYTYYAVKDVYLYWILLLGIVPHYMHLLKKNPNGSAISFHNWLVPISIMIILGTFASRHEDMLMVTYLSLFGLFYAVGEFFTTGKLRNNAFRIIGSLGQLSFLLVLSFSDSSRYLFRSNIDWGYMMGSKEVIVALVITIITVFVIFLQRKGKPIQTFNPLTLSFILAIGLFFMGFASGYAVLAVNLLLVAIGVLTIRKGAKQDHLGILNYGLLIISALIVCRFFDTNINFIVKGVLFVLLGVSFFYTNYLIIKKRNKNVKK
ncbi:MAG: DUF2157 domain-containing protein [Crocinitomix sp.]|nr:DUF2157 domain-containing protein [Crocinitomix sp.]